MIAMPHYSRATVKGLLADLQLKGYQQNLESPPLSPRQTVRAPLGRLSSSPRAGSPSESLATLGPSLPVLLPSQTAAYRG